MSIPCYIRALGRTVKAVQVSTALAEKWNIATLREPCARPITSLSSALEAGTILNFVVIVTS